MTVLLSASRNIPAGANESPVFAVPGNIKQPGVSLDLRLSLGAEQFPNGTTVVTVFISTDGGATYRSGTNTFVMPTTFEGPAPHFWTVGYQVGENEVPTHAKYATNAPSAFTTTAKLEAL